MKQVFCALSALLISVLSFSQGNSNHVIPELVFQNPVLLSGTAGQNGAVYKFSNVAAGIDATVTIAARSSNAVVLTNIDVTETGWNKAFQPQFGIPGYVPTNQNWWMEFEMRFYKAGTTNKQKIKGFNVTAIDVDGDGVSIREYLQMNKTTSVAYCAVNYLAPQAAGTNACTYDDVAENKTGTDRKVLGPVTNFTNIDTLGTPVMATFAYTDKDMISFRYGAQSGGVISNAGERLNSLWFKSFTLTPPSTLPIRFSAFTAMYDKKKAVLNWSAQTDENTGYFIVERSTDGVNFQAVSQLVATQGQASYSYNDEAVPSTGVVAYYRIKSVEKSGEANYTGIKLIRLNKEAAAKISVYPNPVQKTANITLPASWQNQQVTISIYNAAGTEVYKQSIKAASQTEGIDLGQLPKGFYVVKTLCNGQLSEERIIRN